MGMFDTLHDVRLVCPYCGSSDKADAQTKQTQAQGLRVFNVHYPAEKEDLVEGHGPMNCGMWCQPGWGNREEDPHAIADHGLRVLTALASCHEAVCKAYARMEDLITMGYISGFSRHWEVEYDVDPKTDVVCGPPRITRSKPGSYASMVRKLKAWLKAHPRVAKEFAPILKAHAGDYGLAIMRFHSDTEFRRKHGK